MAVELELLDEPASDGVRAIVLALLADATDAAARVGNSSDEEALHDFRVAVRRLRSTLRAWRRTLGASLRNRDLRRLRKIARATNAARDNEVLEGWIEAARDKIAKPHQQAADWIADRLKHRRRQALGRDVTQSVKEFLRCAPGLVRRLAAEDPSIEPEPLGLSLAALVREQADTLAASLAKALSPPDAARAHEARIEGKRLRYLLEPFRETPGLEVATAVKALKRMQDALGALNDARVAGAEFATARVEAAAERVRGGPDAGPGLRPGLMALERLAHRKAAELLADAERDYAGGRGVTVLGPSLAVAEALEKRARQETPKQTVSRYLLSGLPPEAASGAEAEVEKGWLPGVRPRECFGEARGPGGTRQFRVVHVGARTHGQARDVSPEVFEAYWPLTEGRRIRKRCRTLAGGWRLDEYLDRSLVLAVHDGAAGEPPAWLGPWIVREVTGERAYRDEALALRPPRRRTGRSL